MNLNVQKRIAAKILKCSPKKVKLDQSQAEEIKESITKRDISGLIKSKAIVKKAGQETSRGRARKIQQQKSKGKRKGPGSRKGKINASVSRKQRWMSKIRAQRKLLKEMKEQSKVSKATYADLYRKSKGGFFRSRRHIMVYAKENDLLKNEKQ